MTWQEQWLRGPQTYERRIWARQEDDDSYPSNAQSKEEMKGREHKFKSSKHPPEHIAESDKHEGNSKCMKARKGTDSDGSRAYTQGPFTTYLYPINTQEVGHGSRISKGVVWWQGEREGLF